MKKTFYLFIASLLWTACSESINEQIVDGVEISSSESLSSHWGNKIEDPYSIQNMRRAYDELLKEGEGSLSKAGRTPDKITPTHLYLKFIPQNYEEWELLKCDSVLDVVPIPYDYDMDGFDGVYRDPECPIDKPTYQYSVVNIGYPLPNVEYQVVDSLFIPYADDMSKSGEYDSFYRELELKSMIMTGNYYEEQESESLSKKYHPDGKVTYYDNVRGEVGIPNARVHVNFSTRKRNCYTDATGYFRISSKYSYKVHYHVYFENSDLKVCGKNKSDVIASYGGRGISCYDFGITSPQKKGAAITHCSAYDFLYKRTDLDTRHNDGMSIYFSDYDEYGSNAITFTNDLLGAKVNGPNYSNHALRYRDAVYIMSGMVLEKKKNMLITSDDKLNKIWCDGVAWYVTKDVYKAYASEECLVKDLMDNDNSVHDKVSGYTLQTIYSCVLKSKTMDDLKRYLRDNTTSVSNKNGLDELFNYWKLK